MALIIRCRIYTLLQREKEKLDKEPNFMTVPAAIKELEKIEMVKGLDGRYRMDQAMTRNQKIALDKNCVACLAPAKALDIRF